MRDDYGKLYFNILDYTGSATRLFADPAFDGEPVSVTQQQIDAEGQTVPGSEEIVEAEAEEEQAGGPMFREVPDSPYAVDQRRRKYCFDGGQVEIAAHLVYELAPDGTHFGPEARTILDELLEKYAAYGTNSSSFPMYSRFRRSPTTATFERSSASSAALTA